MRNRMVNGEQNFCIEPSPIIRFTVIASMKQFSMFGWWFRVDEPRWQGREEVIARAGVRQRLNEFAIVQLFMDSVR